MSPTVKNSHCRSYDFSIFVCVHWLPIIYFFQNIRLVKHFEDPLTLKNKVVLRVNMRLHYLSNTG